MIEFLPSTIAFALILILVAVLFYMHRLAANLRESEKRVAEVERRPAVLSHEIRTPLSLIRGAAELLAEQSPGPLNATQEMFVSTILDNAQLVADMAEDFLLEARFESGMFSPALSVVDVRAIVAETAREVRRILSASIAVEASGGVLPIISDEKLIRQMTWNLINNAARHANTEEPIVVRVREITGGGCTITILDSGKGITDRDREYLFTPFATGSSRRPGSGLGMMVVKRIVEVLEGKIMIESEPGRGTTVVVSLPNSSVPELKAEI